MKKLIALLLAFIMIFMFVTACADTTQDDGKNDEKENVEDKKDNDKKEEDKKDDDGEDKRTMVKVGCKNNITSMAPFQAPNPFFNVTTNGIFQFLCQRSEFGDTEMSPGLAKEWKKIDDVTYSFELYDYITDSAGNAVKAEDVAFSIETARSNGVVQANSVADVNVTGEYTFEITLISNANGLIEGVCENIYIVSKKSYEESPDGMSTTPVGTGPYALTNYVAGATLTVEKRDDYWQTEELNASCYAANVDVIQYDIITESTQLEGALLQDTVQLAPQVNNENIAALEADERYDLGPSPYGSTRILCFNMTDSSPFKDIRLREAVCYAIDANGIVAGAANGYAQVADGVGKLGLIGFNEDWHEGDGYYAYDPDKAKDLIEEAGYKPGEITVRIANNGLKATVAYYEMIKVYLEAVGFKVEVTNYEVSVYGSKQIDVFCDEWDIILAYSISSSYEAGHFASWLDEDTFSHGYTQGGLEDPELQELLDVCQTPEWTQDKVNELHDYIRENCLGYYFLQEQTFWCANTDITEMFYSAKDPMDFRVGACTYADSYSYYAD